MKPIEETHPSLTGVNCLVDIIRPSRIAVFRGKQISDELFVLFDDVQKHTIDKALLKEEFYPFLTEMEHSPHDVVRALSVVLRQKFEALGLEEEE